MKLHRRIIPVAILVFVAVGTAAVAAAQEITGGCHATVNGQTLDTLTRKTPLLVAKGDTVNLVGIVPASTADDTVSSQTNIYVEVVGDIPVASEGGSGPSWGGEVAVPDVITLLAPGVYKVKGTAIGEGWVCEGSAYVKVEGGPLTIAAAVGLLVAASGAMTAARSRHPKTGQVFEQRTGEAAGFAGPEIGARVAADAATIVLFLVLVVLVGSFGPSWVL